MKYTYDEIDGFLTGAADQLDALWSFLEDLGMRDSMMGVEYDRISLAPKLRDVARELPAE